MRTLDLTLEYGRTGLAVRLPADRVVGPLEIRAVEPLPDPERAVESALRSPIASRPLAEIARGKSDACILVCDITRPVPNALILRPILKTLPSSTSAGRETLTRATRPSAVPWTPARPGRT